MQIPQSLVEQQSRPSCPAAKSREAPKGAYEHHARFEGWNAKHSANIVFGHAVGWRRYFGRAGAKQRAALPGEGPRAAPESCLGDTTSRTGTE
jgi:hypothetical protein